MISTRRSSHAEESHHTVHRVDAEYGKNHCSNDSRSIVKLKAATVHPRQHQQRNEATTKQQKEKRDVTSEANRPARG